MRKFNMQIWRDGKPETISGETVNAGGEFDLLLRLQEGTCRVPAGQGEFFQVVGGELQAWTHGMNAHCVARFPISSK